MTNVHVGIQISREPVDLVRADASEARWDIDVDVVVRDGQIDFRGLAVQGKRGERFIYLTWGEVTHTDTFEMFRRAKLMLNRIDAAMLDPTLADRRLLGTIDLTGSDGGPRCARVDPPAIQWSIEQ
jgi:hypothetical protein